MTSYVLRDEQIIYKRISAFDTIITLVKKNIKKPQTDEMIRFMKKKVPLLLEYSIVFLLGDKIFDISSALFTFP